jgi:uncharacterized protein YjbI with pentapeptide repeats
MSQRAARLKPENYSAISPAELAEMLDAHALFASKRSGKRAKLVSCDLSGANLVNRNLAHAKLSGSLFYGASMRFANLEQADLYCADLRNIDGRYANFTQADMRGVTLEGSNFEHARLDFVDFRPGRLGRAGLWGIEEIVDRNASATGVNFSYCSLRGASLENAKLQGANFTGAVIHGTKFKGARLAGASFDDAIFTDVDVNELPISREALKRCVLPSSPEALAKAPHLLARLEAHQRCIDAYLRSGMRSGLSIDFDDEDLRPIGGQIGQYKLTAISARRAVASGVDFSCTELQGANFEGADLRGVSFEGADLRGANLRGAKLQHAKFTAANLRPLELRSGGVQACDLSDSEVSPEQLTEAIRE